MTSKFFLRRFDLETVGSLTHKLVSVIYFWTLASPAMGHWGTCPPRLPASYFGDHSLYRLWRVMRTFFCPVERFLAIGSADCQKQRDFCTIFINFWPIFVTFCPRFSSGSNYSSQNAGTIGNKFQLHTYFRFR